MSSPEIDPPSPNPATDRDEVQGPDRVEVQGPDRVEVQGPDRVEVQGPDRIEVQDVVQAGDATASDGAPTRGATGNGSPPDEQVLLEHESRLHVATLLLPAAETLIASVVPLVIASFFTTPFVAVSFFVVFVLLPSVAYHAIRFFTLTYRMAGRELIIRSGLLSHRERRIPFDRVQEVEIRQSFLHRLWRLAKVNISTAGSDTQEAALNVLTMHEAEEIKSVISDKHRATNETIQFDDVAPIAGVDYGFSLDVRTLVVGGLTSKVVATLGALVGAFLYFQVFVGLGGKRFDGVNARIVSEAQKQFPGPEFLNRLESELPDTGVLRFVVDLWMMEALSKSIVLAFFGLVFAVVAYVVRYHAFQLSRAGNLLSMSHGLLTYRHSSLARDRIQALKLEESLLRRWFGLAAVRVDSAGDHQQVDKNKHRDVLVPVAKIADATEVTRQAIPGLADVSPDWRRISPLAVKRGSKKGWLLIALIMLQNYFMGGWYCLMWIPAFPIIYLLNYKWYQYTGYWHSDDYLLFRKGWINRATVCVPIKNVQSVALEQNFFDRRLDLASLSIDIAGQSNTGGGPRIRQLPLAAAESLQSRLSQLAAESEFRW